MRVLYCKNGFAEIDGSMERMTMYALANQGAGNASSVTVVQPFSISNQYVTRLRAAGIRVGAVADSLTANVWRVRRQVTRLKNLHRGASASLEWSDILLRTLTVQMRRLRPDVVHTLVDCATPLIIRAALAAGVPVVCSEAASPRSIEGSDVLYDELAVLMPRCAAVVAQSQTLATQIRERVPYNGPIEILGNLVSDPGDSEGRQRVTRDGQIWIGFAARLDRSKNADLLLEAFADVAWEFPLSNLRLAGAGEMLDALRSRAVALGINDKCAFVGPYTGVAARNDFMRSLDIFVLPSMFEGIPNSMLEAMAAGLPIIATAVSGVPDAAAGAAMIIPSGSRNALANALQQLLADPGMRSEMGRQARHTYEIRFSPTVVVPQLLEMYRKVTSCRQTS